MPRTPLFAALALALSCASAPEPDDEAELARVEDPSDPSDMAGEPPLDSWEERLAADLAALGRDQPALVAELQALAPVATRAGHPRFASAALERPEAAAVLADRLSRGSDPPPVRAALAEALPRTGGPFAAALAGLLPREADPEVRVAMVAALRRGAGAASLAGLRAGLRDADPRVRATAAEVASRRQDGAALADALIDALADRADEVRVAAARSLGALQVAAAFAPLQKGLSDQSAEIRLHTLRALARIDGPRTAALPELAGLARDADPRVVNAAADIARRPARR